MFANLPAIGLHVKKMAKSYAVALSVGLSIFTANTTDAACDKAHNHSEIDPAQLLASIKQEQHALHLQRMALKNSVLFPMLESPLQREAIRYQEEVTDKVIFSNSNIRTLNDELKTLAQAITEGKCHQAHQAAITLKNKTQRMRENFDASKTLYPSKTAASQGKETLMMYRMMKSVNEPSPIADYAHQLNNEADEALSHGDLVTALRKYQQAELTFNQNAFKEVVDGFKRNQEAAKAFAETKRENVRKEVLQYLENHFVTIPEGRFLMGSNRNDTDERPQHSVDIKAFKLGKTEIPFALWDLCQNLRICLHRPDDEHWGRGNHPVINVSYTDIVERFIPWLTLMTGKHYRLPTEAEWEYAARAGSTTDFAWGDNLNCTQAQFDSGFSSECQAKVKNRTVKSESFGANAWGLFDMHGNVWEWVESCYSGNYNNDTQNNNYTDDNNDTDKTTNSQQCQVMVLRGGSWKEGQDSLRSSNRFYFVKNARKNNFGFRLVEE